MRQLLLSVSWRHLSYTARRRLVLSLILTFFLYNFFMHARLILRIFQPTAISTVLAIDAIRTVRVVVASGAIGAVRAVLFGGTRIARRAVLARCTVWKWLDVS
jgi:uncharacterized membrane protein